LALANFSALQIKTVFPQPLRLLDDESLPPSLTFSSLQQLRLSACGLDADLLYSLPASLTALTCCRCRIFAAAGTEASSRAALAVPLNFQLTRLALVHCSGALDAWVTPLLRPDGPLSHLEELVLDGTDEFALGRHSFVGLLNASAQLRSLSIASCFYPQGAVITALLDRVATLRFLTVLDLSTLDHLHPAPVLLALIDRLGPQLTALAVGFWMDSALLGAILSSLSEQPSLISLDLRHSLLSPPDLGPPAPAAGTGERRSGAARGAAAWQPRGRRNVGWTTAPLASNGSSAWHFPRLASLNLRGISDRRVVEACLRCCPQLRYLEIDDGVLPGPLLVELVPGLQRLHLPRPDPALALYTDSPRCSFAVTID
jgi:hypothetical protein